MRHGHGWLANSPRGRLLAAAAVIATLALAAAAYAAIGDLTPTGCIDDNDTGPDTCATDIDGLDGAEAVVASPDGKSVYVASGDDRTIEWFRRAPSGALTFRGCVEGQFAPESCDQSIPYFLDPSDIAISNDGESVYLLSRFADSGLYRFARNTSTGKLRFRDCEADAEVLPPGCDAVDGIADPTGLAVSPDDKSVYVADFGGNTLVRFNRNAASGALTAKGCIADNDFTEETCARTVNGLSAADAVVVSPDGADVYVASAFDDTVVDFGRNQVSGKLGDDRCAQDIDLNTEFCTRFEEGMGRPEDLAISPDGTSLYVVGRDDNALVRFDRLPNGTLRPKGCFVDNDFPGEPCGDSPKGLDGAHAVVVSPDDATVYVVAQAEDAITPFARAPDGALTARQCTRDNDTVSSIATCPLSTDGLDGAVDVALSPSGDSAYVVSGFQDNAIVSFDRTPAP